MGVDINWNLLGPPADIGGAFQAGMQRGQQVRRQQEVQNALQAFAQNPDDRGALNALAAYAPQIGIPLMKERREREQREMTGQTAQRASSGDRIAKAQLWGMDPALAARMDDRDFKRAEQGMNAIGNAAYEVALLPPEQQAAAWDQRIDYLSQSFPDLQAQKGKYSPEALMGVLAQTGMTQKVLEAREPKMVAVPQGGYLEDVNPNSRGRPVTSGPQPGMIEDGHRFLGGNPADPASWEPVGGAGSGQQTFP